MEDVYGFEYLNGRDLSGFIDGTENPKGNLQKFQVAVNPITSGSFCVRNNCNNFCTSLALPGVNIPWLILLADNLNQKIVANLIKLRINH